MVLDKKKVLIGLCVIAVIFFGLGVIYGQQIAYAPKDVFKESLAASEAEKKEVVIDLKGAVEKPGLYRLPEGSRVDDVLNQGILAKDADTSSLNLARELEDGELLRVPYRKDTPAENTGSSESVKNAAKAGSEDNDISDNTADIATTKIDINSASQALLESLPGIGPAKASAIIEYRNSNGPFSSIEEIMDVSGIGEATYENIKELISVE